MAVELDASNWSGEGDFTQQLVDWCADQPAVAAVRVEDAPAAAALSTASADTTSCGTGRTGAMPSR